MVSPRPIIQATPEQAPLARRPWAHRAQTGFTLIELLVVLACVALLLSVVAPRYLEHVDRAREAALRVNLAALREAIDRFQSDRGQYPQRLDDLVAQRYLRAVPLDPVTERADTWRLVAALPGPGAGGDAPVPSDVAGRNEPQAGHSELQAGIADVRSAAPGTARDGTAFSSW